VIEQTFLHMAGVGHATEQRLWRNGYCSWEHLWRSLSSGLLVRDVLRDHYVQKRLFEEISPRERHARTIAWIDCLDESRRCWKARDYRFFTDLLRPGDQWRLLASAWKDALFLDIETTGLSRELHYTTVIGVLFQGKFHQWVWPQPLDELRELLHSARLLVTFNGRRFDVPFLQSHVADLSFPEAHVDLLYIANAAGLKGGQKAVEESVGLKRDEDIRDLGGREAVLAWCSGLYGDKKAYQQLLKYNRADVEMMPQLALQLCSKLVTTVKCDLKEPKRRISVKVNAGHKASDYASLRTCWEQHRPGLHLLEPKLLQRFKRAPKVVGIDLRGKPENPTGWAVCQGSRADTCVLFNDHEIIGRTVAENPDVVSIDAPLALPRGRQSAFDDSPCRKEGGIVRDAERILWARGVGVYPALIPHMQKLTERGMRLAQRLESLGIKVIESYPGAAQDVLGIPRKRANEDLLTRGLCEFGYAFDDGKSHDELDAITSALVGYFYLADEYEAIGADDECFMIIPKWNAMSWAGNLAQRTISLIGLPGAGKTTLSRALSERLGWRNFVLGDELRKQAEKDPKLKDSLEGGALAPESHVYDAIRRVRDEENSAGLILDGFPRHIGQLADAQKLFSAPTFLYLNVAPDIAIQRLLNRICCESCGSIFNRDDVRDCVCPNCRTSSWQTRPEDAGPIVRERVRDSMERLNLLRSSLQKSDIIHLDASRSVENVTEGALRELLTTRFG
jgi:uncharacterized protein YprB with RNaseH-like and TPR domain/predicted nuclease with RNAse H fold/adenylate kinase family enzyme